MALQRGDYVVNERVPAWGTGKVLSAFDGKGRVLFESADGGPKQMPVGILRRLELDGHLRLDLLTAASSDGSPLRSADRSFGAVFEHDLAWFLQRLPLAFSDPIYLRSERDFKMHARGAFLERLGPERLRARIQEEAWDKLTADAIAVVRSSGNLLSRFEIMAFTGGLDTADPSQSAPLFASLLQLIEEHEPSESVFTAWADAVEALPTTGQKKTDSWPIVSLFAFNARPDVHAFVKPKFTKATAKRYGVDLAYESHPNWRTYSLWLRMVRTILEDLRPHGARDLIDAQSFLWILDRGDSYQGFKTRRA